MTRSPPWPFRPAPNLHLHVPLLDGGQMKGNLGAPEVQIFRNKPANRDLIQNPRDAWVHSGGTAEDRRGSPVVIRLERIRIATADLPCSVEIRDNLRHCEMSWGGVDAERAVFTRAVEALGEPTLDCLMISDFNTTGAAGLDHQISMPWYIMTRGLGVTTKAAGQGGSRGLGKVTAFLLSKIGTVLFGTMLPNGDRSFIGNVLAATFTAKGPNLPHERQNMWLVGGPGGSTVTDPRLIPRFMARSVPGTDLLVAAHRFGKNWVDQTATDIVDSWWMAIERGEIRIEIEDRVSSKPKSVVVDGGSLDHFLKKDTILFHRAYKQGDFRDHQTQTIGECTTRTISGPAAGGLKAFAMTRENGMVVYKRRLESNVEFCGVFECPNPEGNAVLRLMESATHDDWKPGEHPDPAAGKRAEDDYMAVIRSVRDELNGAAGAAEDESTGLADLLPLETLEWEGGGVFIADPTVRKRERRTVRLGGGGRGKTFEVDNLVAMVAGIEEGEYELEIHHPTGDDAAMIAVGIAGDANVVDIAEVKRALDAEGNAIGIDPEYQTIGPVRLAKGANTVRVDIDDMRRLAVQVFQMREVQRKGETDDPDEGQTGKRNLLGGKIRPDHTGKRDLRGSGTYKAEQEALQRSRNEQN